MTTPASTLIVTGGAGFIGSNLVRLLLAETDAHVVTLDKLSYAGRRESLTGVLDNPRHEFVRGDIGDAELVASLLAKRRPRGVLHLAAETHVDRSIDDPDAFIRTNLLGAGNLLLGCLAYWEKLPAAERDSFRFVHVSTDEVFGSLEPDEAPFAETSRYQPRSPYAASKAGSDHLTRSFWHTYGLPTLVTNSSNNYGPYQFPEKLVPLTVLRALAGQPLPIYGDGQQVRDWLHVEDQCQALRRVLDRGAPGSSYNIGAEQERTNLELVGLICDAVDAFLPDRSPGETQKLVTHVADRPGHDRRYAINATRARQELGWQPTIGLEEGIRRTIRWYAEHPDWIAAATRRVDWQSRRGLRQ